MTINPTYTLMSENLTVASPANGITVPEPFQLIHFLSARNAAGELQPGALIDVMLGTAEKTTFPLRLNNKIFVKGGFQARLSWDAQAGITEAKILFSPDPTVLEADFPAPAQLVTGTMTLSRATGIIGSSEVSVSATSSSTLFGADVTRRGAWFKASPLNTSVIWVAGGSPADKTGHPLWPGEEMYVEGGPQLAVYNPSGSVQLISKLRLLD